MSRFSVTSEHRYVSAATVSAWMRFQERSDLHQHTRIERANLTEMVLAHNRFGFLSQQLTERGHSTNTSWHFGMQSVLTFHIYANSSKSFMLIFSAVIAATAIMLDLKLITVA